jgi:aldehyde dehydrogenase (NAD+)
MANTSTDFYGSDSVAVAEPLHRGHNYIDGSFITRKANTKTYKNINPSTAEALGSFPQSTQDDIDTAYNAARSAFSTWRKLSRVQRAEYLNKVAEIVERDRDKLARIISLETGKNYNESIAEVNEALHMAQFAFGSGRIPTGDIVSSEIAEKDSYMIRKPKGVIAVVSPFNFPIAIGMFWNAAPALVEGNTVIVKPSEDAPWSTHAAMEIYHEAGVPAGVINVVHGDGQVGDMLIRTEVDHICFTGSATVGQHIRRVAAESWHKTTSCEMGSKSACIVFEDSQPELVIEACVASAFKLSGQRCVSSGRMLIQRTVIDEFVKEFAKRAEQLTTGDPFSDPAPYYGPIINEPGFAKIKAMNKLVEDDPNAEILVQPTYTGASGTYYSTPMVYKTEWRDVPYLKQEVFGPHVAIIPFDDVDDAIRIYNDTEYGLAVGILTENYKVARKMRDECDAGMIYWNGGSIAAESHLSFGGVKKSGNGFPTAAKTWQSVTHTVSWTVNHDDQISFPQGMTK